MQCHKFTSIPAHYIVPSGGACCKLSLCLESQPSQHLHEVIECSQVKQGDMKDILAVRTEDEEALCAVCSGGLSAAPNLIVFCERCDIAVHQKCYGIDTIPAGKLSVPCHMF